MGTRRDWKFRKQNLLVVMKLAMTTKLVGANSLQIYPPPNSACCTTSELGSLSSLVATPFQYHLGTGVEGTHVNPWFAQAYAVSPAVPTALSRAPRLSDFSKALLSILHRKGPISLATTVNLKLRWMPLKLSPIQRRAQISITFCSCWMRLKKPGIIPIYNVKRY